jgi:hypothetical protein
VKFSGGKETGTPGPLGLTNCRTLRISLECSMPDLFPLPRHPRHPQDIHEPLKVPRRAPSKTRPAAQCNLVKWSPQVVPFGAAAGSARYNEACGLHSNLNSATAVNAKVLAFPAFPVVYHYSTDPRFGLKGHTMVHRYSCGHGFSGTHIPRLPSKFSKRSTCSCGER